MEIELKYELASNKDYLHLLKYLKEKGEYKGEKLQKNYYFDTPSLFFSSNGILFRLREEKDKNIFTIKLAKRRMPGLNVSEEKEVLLSSELASILKIDPTSISKVLDNKNLIEFFEKFKKDIKLIGTLNNKRIVFLLNDFNIEVDKISIGKSKIYYEVEIETPEIEKARLLIETIFNETKISWRLSNLVKSQRLFNYLKEIRKKES